MAQIDFFCARWGFESIDWNVFLRRVKRAGYVGVEWFPFAESHNHADVIELIKKHGLQHSIVMTVRDTFTDIEEYLNKLTEDLKYLAVFSKENLPPRFVSAQVGREFFEKDEIEYCINLCSGIEKETGINIHHETHRNKWSYAAHIVYPFLKRFQNLRLTLDISHWFCVSESYLEDQQSAVQLAIKRASHIHARVGSTQGPQVLDPVIPLYEKALNEHLKIWDTYVALANDSKQSCSITPEFGPPPYMVATKGKSAILEKQWRLNLWMMEFLKKRYSTDFFR